MELKFRIKKGGFYVTDALGETKYTVKLAADGRFLARVYDELGVSELIRVEKNEKGFGMSAFDTDLGILGSREEKVFSTADGAITATENGEDFEVKVYTEIGKVCFDGDYVTVFSQRENRGIIFLAVAMALYYDKQMRATVTDKKTPPTNTDKKAVAHGEKTKSARPWYKTVISVADALVTALGRAIRKGGTQNKNAVKLRGKSFLVFALTAMLSLLFTIAFCVTAIVLNNKNLNFSKAVATVENRFTETVATYTVNGVVYVTEDVPGEYHTYDKFTVYYSLNSDGIVNECRLTEYSVTVYVVLTAVCFVISILLALPLKFGLPHTFAANNKKRQC